MKLKRFGVILLMVVLGVACSDDEKEEDFETNVTLEFSFDENEEGWTHGFADYPEGEEEFYELSFEHAKLPEPLDQTQGTLKQSGNNHSDDLFMFVKKKVSDLAPNEEYKVAFDIEIASNVPDNSFGVGGSPGSSVYIKAGISSDEPIGVKQDDGYYRMNIDKNNQANGGADMKVLGDFENGTDSNNYALKTLLYNSGELKARTNEKGELWLIIGTDSGFEATTTIYYNKIQTDLTLITE